MTTIRKIGDRWVNPATGHSWSQPEVASALERDRRAAYDMGRFGHMLTGELLDLAQRINQTLGRHPEVLEEGVDNVLVDAFVQGHRDYSRARGEPDSSVRSVPLWEMKLSRFDPRAKRGGDRWRGYVHTRLNFETDTLDVHGRIETAAEPVVQPSELRALGLEVDQPVPEPEAAVDPLLELAAGPRLLGSK